MRKIIQGVMEDAYKLHKIGLIDDARLAEYEALATEAEQGEHGWPPEQIRSLRLKNSLSLDDFAGLLNVSSSTARRWETGRKKPAGTARKLLQILQTHGIDALIC